MAYLVAFAALAVLVGLHELVLRQVLRRQSRRTVAIVIAAAASYLAIAAIAFAMFVTYGMPSHHSFYMVDDVLEGYPAQGKLMRDDRILAIDGVALSVEDGPSLAERVDASAGRPLTLAVSRDGKQLDVTIQPIRAETGHWLLGFKKSSDPDLGHDAGEAAIAALATPAVRLAHLVGGAMPDAQPEPGGPKRLVDEFRIAALPSWLIATRLLIDASVLVWILQIIVDVVRLRRRRPAVRP